MFYWLTQWLLCNESSKLELASQISLRAKLLSFLSLGPRWFFYFFSFFSEQHNNQITNTSKEIVISQPIRNALAISRDLDCALFPALGTSTVLASSETWKFYQCTGLVYAVLLYGTYHVDIWSQTFIYVYVWESFLTLIDFLFPRADNLFLAVNSVRDSSSFLKGEIS